MLVGIGALVCLWRSRRDETARVALGLMVLSLALYSGRRVVGPVLDRLPGGSDLLLHRYIIGVHFAGMLLAGIGAVWAFRTVVSGGAVRAPDPGPDADRGRDRVRARRRRDVAGARRPRPLRQQRHGRTSTGQVAADQTDGAAVNSLIDIAKQRGGGRVYAGLPNNWGGADQGRPGRRCSTCRCSRTPTRSDSRCAPTR